MVKCLNAYKQCPVNGFVLSRKLVGINTHTYAYILSNILIVYAFFSKIQKLVQLINYFKHLSCFKLKCGRNSKKQQETKHDLHG